MESCRSINSNPIESRKLVLKCCGRSSSASLRSCCPASASYSGGRPNASHGSSHPRARKPGRLRCSAAESPSRAHRLSLGGLRQTQRNHLMMRKRWKKTPRAPHHHHWSGDGNSCGGQHLAVRHFSCPSWLAMRVR